MIVINNFSDNKISKTNKKTNRYKCTAITDEHQSFEIFIEVFSFLIVKVIHFTEPMKWTGRYI